MQKPQVWPVIHFLNEELALHNAGIANDAGAVGVFLISMHGDDEPLIDVAKRVKQAYPSLKVGVNHLSLAPLLSLQLSLNAGLDATWTDGPGVTGSGVSQQARDVASLLKLFPEHQFFGSVAFKYRAPEPDPERAAVNAMNLGMIATTSGDATGRAADPGKIARMRRAVTLAARPSNAEHKGDAPGTGDEFQLGIASGITPENVGDFMGLVSHILVATGISHDEHRLDYEKLARLIGRINQAVPDAAA
ncbi:hypothetical protein F6X40_34535 [Paraburkholderia sp. UCT31]|uniref:hypothetical protein n=1 Tax=Paraburkholderia sp. UCT31 TaxID=2615209 RepID=UPI001656550A|nr:hypothetical protein [Paraburkholderia sp. UCT31]MBC8741681.1 hypothetical protein [Paraburkholderia sp. UCT31]